MDAPQAWPGISNSFDSRHGEAGLPCAPSYALPGEYQVHLN